MTEARASPGARPARWLDRIGPRFAALLTVALLPLGLIGFDQTRRLSEEAERREGLALLALTREGAAPLQQGVERALGTAGAVARLAVTLKAGLGSEDCDQVLSSFAGPGSPYAFLGVLPAEGPVTCSTAGAPFEPADPAALARALADPGPRVRPGMAGPLAGPASEDVVVVSVPYGSPTEGLVALSLRRSAIAPSAIEGPIRPLQLAVLNADGEVVQSLPSGPEIGTLLPPDLDLAGNGARIVDAGDSGRILTLTPVVPDVLYAVAVWGPGQGAPGPGSLLTGSLVFLLTMWLASLVVAVWAAHRLVVRPVRALDGAMRRFGATRDLPDGPLTGDDAPFELRQIEAAFRDAARAILHDEAQREDAFRERGVLLREIHHRVKNNLQLISSIISMQARRSPDPRLRQVLRRLQDRVLTLAAIYRTLYLSADVSRASVAPIIGAIVEQETAGRAGAVTAEAELADLVLDADQAVPLAFLVAEAVSNAAAQAARAPGGARVLVRLARRGEEGLLEVVNPLPPGREAGDGLQPPGLGSQLIAAFAAQLRGRVESGPREGSYRLAVTFPLPGGGDGTGSDGDHGQPEARLSA